LRAELEATATHAIVAIRDTGPGVPAGLLDRVFEPFFSTRQRGSGLGLAICAAIAQTHDAKLKVANAPAGGAVFTIEFPLALEAFAARVKEIQPSALTVAIGGAGDEGEAVDFRLPAGFGAPDLRDVLHRTEEKLRLVRELTALRSSVATPTEAPAARADEPWDGAAFGRVLKEFTRAFAAGFHLPRVLEMFLDAIGELVRPTRTALLLPEADGRDYRIAAHRGLAPQIVESVRLPATAGLARWLA